MCVSMRWFVLFVVGLVYQLVLLCFSVRMALGNCNPLLVKWRIVCCSLDDGDAKRKRHEDIARCNKGNSAIFIPNVIVVQDKSGKVC